MHRWILLKLWERLSGSMYSRMDQLNFLKAAFYKILLGPFLNALTHLLEQFSSHFRRHTFIFNFPEAKLLVTNTKYLIRVPKTASTLLKSL